MSNLKFRQFDKRLNDFMFFELNNGRVHIVNSDIESFDIDRKDSPQERFTGFQDINGNDIYEGDLSSKNDDKFVKSGVVSFIHGCWMVASKSGERYFNLHWHLSQVEVVGNVHQNPELLEQNDE